MTPKKEAWLSEAEFVAARKLSDKILRLFSGQKNPVFCMALAMSLAWTIGSRFTKESDAKEVADQVLDAFQWHLKRALEADTDTPRLP